MQMFLLFYLADLFRLLYHCHSECPTLIAVCTRGNFISCIKFHLIKIHVPWQFDSCRLLKLFCLRISWGSFEISWWSFTSVLNKLLNWLIHKQLVLFLKDTKNNERSLLQEYRNICAKRFHSNTAVFISSISFSWLCLFEMEKKNKLTQNFTHGNRNGLWYFTEEYWILYWN